MAAKSSLVLLDCLGEHQLPWAKMLHAALQQVRNTGDCIPVTGNKHFLALFSSPALTQRFHYPCVSHCGIFSESQLQLCVYKVFCEHTTVKLKKQPRLAMYLTPKVELKM